VNFCEWKLYLNSCATYHSPFVDWYLKNVHVVDTVLKGSCNTVVTTSNTKGLFGVFEMRLNRRGIASLLSIPQLEGDGYKVTYDTDADWLITTPAGGKIAFQQDTGLCNCMLYIYMSENHAGLALLKTVRKNFEGFAKKQVEKALLACNVQAMVGHPFNGKFNQMVSSSSMKNCPIYPVRITNSLAIFGPHHPDLRGKSVR